MLVPIQLFTLNVKYIFFMITNRPQQDGRIINLPIYVSNHITDDMIDQFLTSGQALSVNAGRISEQVILPYLETYLGPGRIVDADGYDHLFDSGIRNEHKKLVIKSTSATAKNIGSNKQGKCDTISFHHPGVNKLYIIQSNTFYDHIAFSYDKASNAYNASFYSDMQLQGKGKRIGCGSWHNTKLLLEHATYINLP